METDPKSQKDLKLSKIFLAILACIGILFIVWAAWFRPDDKSSVDSFDECIAAGNPVQESYPEVCVTPDGQRFPNPDHQTNDSAY
jgi:hypothetical protein